MKHLIGYAQNETMSATVLEIELFSLFHWRSVSVLYLNGALLYPTIEDTILSIIPKSLLSSRETS